MVRVGGASLLLRNSHLYMHGRGMAGGMTCHIVGEGAVVVNARSAGSLQKLFLFNLSYGAWRGCASTIKKTGLVIAQAAIECEDDMGRHGGGDGDERQSTDGIDLVGLQDGCCGARCWACDSSLT